MTPDIPVPAKPITDPGHGESFTEHMFSAEWSDHAGWHDAKLSRLDHLSLHPATIGLHYGQAIFEGLKAFRQADGSMGVFRPRRNARRMRGSARRLAMPELDDELFIRAIEELVAADEAWLSGDPAHSLYLRPLVLATDVSLMLRPSRTYRFVLMAFVAGGFFGDDVEAVSVWVNRDQPRAFPGGTGDVKIAGNYAPTFPAQLAAQRRGCQQVVWLDAEERRWVDEMSGMNLFLVRGRERDAEILTPALTGTLLPGVTRDAVLTLADRLGYAPRARRISLAEWREGAERGDITEAFACGTAAVITPITRVVDGEGGWAVGRGTPGPVTRALRGALEDVQRGRAPDPDGWIHHVPTKR